MYQKMIEEYYDKNFPQMLKSLEEIMSIDSSNAPAEDGKPFGAGSAKALEWAQQFGESLGLSVRNFDNYAVSMDYSHDLGEPVLGILSHLDVVPAGEGWTYPPFACTVDNGNIYGRGAIDDKGPSVAVLYALKCIKELGIELDKNFRIILGGDEENGCKDIEYYSQQEPFPPMVFTPDGSFPVLNCEKGMVHLRFAGKGSFDCEGVAFDSIKGGTVINAIPGKTVCAAQLSNDIESFTFAKMAKRTGNGFELLGKSAHGSRPENGKNTITALLEGLAQRDNDLAQKLSAIFPHGELDGKSAGLGFSDEISGNMTLALTLLDYANSAFTCGIDIRYPIDKTLSQITEIITQALEKSGFEVIDLDGMEPHYVPQESELVQALLRTYETVKGEKGFCVAEGGVTYVHNTPGGVAFGAEFPDECNNMHSADEHISLETIKLNFQMYITAIINLCANRTAVTTDKSSSDR